MLPRLYQHIVPSPRTNETHPVETYQWWDKINCSLTRIDVVIFEFSIEVEIYKSPIMMRNVDAAIPLLQFNRKDTYGKEFIKVLAHAIGWH